MADTATLVQQYLAFSAKPKRLNLYTVLGLVELIDDRAVISASIESAIKKLQSADRTTDPAGFEQVVKVVRQARATLLDDQKKRTYDTQLRASLTKKPRAVEASSAPSSESSPWSSLFPTGDPAAPFSMADFLKHPKEFPEFETAAERHVAIAQLSRKAQPSPSNPVNQPDAEANSIRQPASNGTLLQLDRPAGSKNTGRELQEMIRRNRRKKNMIATSIALGGSSIILLMGAWMFISNRMEQNRQIAKNKVNSSLANVFQPNGIDTHNDPSSPAEVDSPSESKTNSRMDLGVTPQTTKDLGELPKLGFEDQPATTTEIATEPMKPLPSVVPERMPEKPTTVPETVPETKMDDEKANEKSSSENLTKWVEAMNAARKSMNEKAFEKFATAIETAIDLAETDGQEEQARRLDKFGQLFEKGLTAAREAFLALKSTDEIRYGSAGGKASVVESTENLLVLRISGKNERFSHDKIPMGILMAVVEPKLNDDAVDQAIRGVLLSADPRSNSANKKQAKVHFEKAASMDSAFAKLEWVLEEKYQ